MNYHYPDYYHTFHCIGGQCPDTCCAGWNIEIDNTSLAHYKSAIQSSRRGWRLKPRDPFFTDLKQAIDFRRKTFRLNGRRCALLTEDNLCSLYLHLGKQALCRTCRTYPRHQEEFGNLREISLSLSCPEAARIILSQPSRPVLLSRETSMDCPSDQLVDEKLLHWLMNARERILDIIWNQDIPLETSVSMALAFSHDLNRRHLDRRFYDKEGMFLLAEAMTDLNRLARKYLSPEADKRFIQQVRRLKTHAAPAPLLPAALFHLYAALEPVLDNWADLSDRFRFLPACAPLPERQLLTYFIQVYFPGSIYDDDIFGKMQFAAASWLMVRMLCGALISADPESAALEESSLDTLSPHISALDGLSQNDLWIRAATLYSRQVENSEQNLNTLFDAFQTMKSFRLISFLTALSPESFPEVFFEQIHSEHESNPPQCDPRGAFFVS